MLFRCFLLNICYLPYDSISHISLSLCLYSISFGNAACLPAFYEPGNRIKQMKDGRFFLFDWFQLIVNSDFVYEISWDEEREGWVITMNEQSEILF